MSFPNEKFVSKLPSAWKKVYEVLSLQNFVPTLVGGTVRDFLLHQEIGKDWDVEITHPTLSFSKELWKSLGKELSKLGRISFLPYDVIRLDIDSWQFELSPPRLETFLDTHGHKNFTVDFDFKLPFERAVLRRDFTINSMGVRFLSKKEIEFLDPLNGAWHLSDKVLHHCGPDFGKDPVRYLRAMRFAQRFNLEFSPELQQVLNSMVIIGVAPAYLWSEMQKSNDPVGLYGRLLLNQENHPEFVLPVSGTDALNKISGLRTLLQDPAQHEGWMIAWEWLGLSCTKWQEYFSLGSETARRISRWAESSKAFIKIQPEVFHGEFEEIIEKEEFALLFDWYFTTKQLMQKNPKLPLLEMIEKYLTEWIHLYRFEPVKDVKHIDPPLRAKYQVWNLCQRL